MKNIFKFFTVCIATMFMTSCDTELDKITYSGSAVKFDQLALERQIPRAGLTVSVPISSTTISTVDRTFPVVKSAESTNASEFTVGVATIPANSYTGTVDVTFTFAGITGVDGDVKKAIINFEPNTAYDIFAGSLTITYFRAITCNDVSLFIQADRWGGETGFRIENAAGNVVYTMPAGSLTTVAAGVAPTSFTANFNLPDGCYTAVITDAYGDGQVDGTNPNGFFRITCSIATYATGGGAIGSEQRVPFCVNQ